MEQDKRILAIDLRSRSFGFAVFEGPTRLLDWGVKSFRGGVNAVKIPAESKFAGLMDDFSPVAIVVRKESAQSNKRAAMFAALMDQAGRRRIPIRQVSRQDIRRAFVGCERNKYATASAVAKRFPPLVARLPGTRKIWKSEDYRMSIFDAAALGVANLLRRKIRRCET